MIKEDYCSKDLYKLLLEKGFDGEIRTTHDEEGYTQPSISLYVAMKWLREKCLVICIIPSAFYCGEKACRWGYNIWAGDNLEVDDYNTPRITSYEEAVEAALKYALENLI